MKLRISTALFALLAGGALWGCTTNAAGVTPGLTTGPLGGKLEVTVGTVNFAGAGVGLNIIETFRGGNGYSAVPVNTATLTGPAGFGGPAGSADPGSGLVAVQLGSASNAFAIGPVGTNLAAAQAFGVGPPLNSGTTANPFPAQPQFQDCPVCGGAQASFAAEVPIYGAPPAYPAQAPNAPPGFPEMFYLLALGASPPTGPYSLAVAYSQNGVSSTKTASATLAAGALLATISAPVYTSDGAGGGSLTATAPAGVSQVIVNITDGGQPDAITGGTTTPATPNWTAVFNPSGSITIPAGTFVSTDGGGTVHTTGDALAIRAFGFDFDDFGLLSLPPVQLPALPAQADVTVSAENDQTESIGRHPLFLHPRHKHPR